MKKHCYLQIDQNISVELFIEELTYMIYISANHSKLMYILTF
jgi:hypothetical protein